MATKTIRQRVIDALLLRVGANRGLEQLDDQDMPFTALVTGSESATESYDMVESTLPIVIGRAFKATGTKSDQWYAQGEQSLKDVITEVYVGGEELDGIPVQIEYTGSDVEQLTDGARGVMVQASFDIRYVWLHGDPTKTQHEVV